MASGQFRKVGNGLVAQADYKLSGMVSDSGPYEATIVGHVEGTRMGQLLVTIPDWGGASFDVAEGDSNAIPATYASPFTEQPTAQTPALLRTLPIHRDKVMVCGWSHPTLVVKCW